MKSYVASLLACTSLGIAVLVGCAEGSQADPTESFLSANPADSGAPPDESAKIPPPSNPDTTIDQPGDDAGASSSGGNDGGGSSSGGVACNAPSPCSGATDLGSVSGDTLADSKSGQGSTSQWFKVRVTENYHELDGRELKVTATLTSPSGGAKYDLYTYVASSDGPTECSAVTGTGNNYTAKFGESGLASNGSNDSRWVTFEVRYVSGTCDPNQKWTLKIDGNK